MSTSGNLGTVNIDVIASVANMVSDLGKAQSETRRAVDDMRKTWEGLGDSIGGTFKDIAGTLGLAFSVDRIAEFAKSIVETNAKIVDMAESVGTSAGALTQYSAAAQLAGTNIEEVSVGLGKLAKTANDAAHGSQQAQAAFSAIGVSVRDASGAIKSADVLFDQISQKMAGLENGTGKTAEAMALFGRSGKALIPLMNEWGASVDSARQKAEELGLAISASDAAAFKKLDDTMTEVGLAIRGDFTQALTVLLPYLQDAADASLDLAKDAATVKEQLYEAITVINQVTDALHSLWGELQTDTEDTPFITGIVKGMQNDLDAFAHMVHDVKALGVEMKMGFNIAWTGGNPAQDAIDDFNASMDELDKNLEDSLSVNKEWSQGVQASGQQLKILSDYAGQVSDAFAKTKPSTEDFQKAMDSIGRVAAVAITQGADQAQVAHILDAAYAQLSTTLNNSTRKAFDGFNASTDKASKTAQKLAADVVAMQDFLGGLTAKMGGPYQKAWADYGNAIDGAEKRAAKFIADGGSLAKAQQFIADATALATSKLDEQIDTQSHLDQIMQGAQSELAEHTRLIGLDAEQIRIEAEYTKLMTAADKELLSVMGPLTEADQKRLDSLRDVATQIVKTDEAIKDSTQVQQEWVSIWTRGFDQLADVVGQFFSGQMDSWADFGKSLVNIAKQIVGSIISQFAKLAIINPILNSLFGSAAGGGSLLPTLASAGGLLGGGGAAGGAAAGGDANSLAGIGVKIFGGFQGAFDSFLFGQAGTGTSSGILGTTTYGSFSNSFAPSALGYGASIAGGAYAGYQRYQSSAGGAAGVAGGLTYGLGTTAVGLGVAGVASGAGFAAGVGALGALGPIGWAAIALMAVDMLSGGKLFGTKGKFNFGEQAISVGAGGASVTAGYDLKGQGALFSGSTHSWQTLPTDPAAQAAADQFYAALKSGTESFAKQFGVTMGDVVGGQFIATFDKKGNVTKTESTVLGKTYADTQQQFEERLGAENMLAVLDKLSAGISGAVEQYRANADQLMAVTQALAQAEAMMQSGTQFLALGADQSLTALLALAQGMQGVGETIDQTLQRIEQAQAQYDQFVSQFKVTTFASPFQAALADINAQMQKNIATANALAQAAGAEGASTEDLVRIHQYAAAQFAAAVAQLKANANSLVASLGYGMPQSLSDINAQIAALESQANSGAGAISGFGSAMQSAAQAATNAMNLLLGDLSPLNDQQKLQTALQGLRAGTATAEQVLEIGRRLYATGSDYNALFQQVMAMSRGAHAQVAGGGGGGGSGGQADSQRLADLKEQRDKIEAIQRHSDALTLAQQIADIAGATGDSIDDVLKQIGLDDLPDFMKELGITDKAGFDAFIEKLEKNTDSAGESTAEIADKIDLTNELLMQIRDGTSGGPAGADATGHSGHGRPGAIEENTTAVNNLNTTIQTGGNNGNRSSRGVGDLRVLQRTR